MQTSFRVVGFEEETQLDPETSIDYSNSFGGHSIFLAVQSTLGT